MGSMSASAIAPIAYLILVLGSLAIFSTLYRRRKALESSNLEPWFPTHHQRDIYLTLLHLDSPPCPPKLLKSALLERARENIARIYNIRESKAAATALLAKGSISEATFQQLNAAEGELNMEVQDVVAEAKALGGEDWGKTIMAQANECHQKDLLLKSLERGKVFAEFIKTQVDEDEVLRKEYQENQRKLALQTLGVEDEGNGAGANGDVSVDTMGTPNGNGVKTKKKKNKK
jgi:translocation protein SEC66